MGIFKSYILGEASPDKLNQLKYGQGEGPIVKKRIPTTIQDSGPKSNELTRRVDDLQRIALMFTKPNGLKYLGNEAFLNTLNSEANSKRKTGVGKKLSQLSQGLLSTVKIVGSTLLQVPFNGTGTHFVRGFDKKGKRRFPNEEPASSRETDLQTFSEWVSSLTEATLGYSDVKPLSEYITTLKEEKELSTLRGDIKPQTFEEQTKGITQQARADKVGKDEHLIKPTNSDKSEGAPYSETQLPVEYYSKESLLYTNVRRETRILQGDIDQRSKQGNIYRLGKVDGRDVKTINYADKKTAKLYSDKINLSEPYKSDTVAGIDQTRDIIKFRFAILTPEDTTYLHFRAFLKDFNDSYKGNWNSVNYIGRGETLYSYDKFDRDLSFSFTIAAQTRAEMAPLYRKIAYLASATAPTYNADGYMRGTLARVTIGSYVRELPGYIASVTYDWADGMPWEIALNNPEAVQGEVKEDIDIQELPQVLNCSISFKPIHTFVPETGLKHYITTDVAHSEKSLFFKNGTPVVDGEKRGFLNKENIIYS